MDVLLQDKYVYGRHFGCRDLQSKANAVKVKEVGSEGKM